MEPFISTPRLKILFCSLVAMVATTNACSNKRIGHNGGEGSQVLAEEFQNDRIVVRSDDVWLKTRSVKMDDLAESERCAVKKGEIIKLDTTAPASDADDEDVRAVDAHIRLTEEESRRLCPDFDGRKDWYVYAASFTDGINSVDDNTPQTGGDGLGYRKPVPNGLLGSSWCKCRDVGTSPHIGQDWRLNGGSKSVALNKATVVSVTFSSSCGYQVDLKDKNGANWRYLHLNKPSLKAGDKLSPGDLIGKHGLYPKAACGTGPHLHLERHSAGPFGDSKRSKDCGDGVKNCNYNPNRLLDDGMSLIDFLALNDAADDAEYDNVGSIEVEQASQCRAVADDRVLTELPSAADAATSLPEVAFQAKVSTFPRADGQLAFAVSGELAGNSANSCGADNERECIVSLTVYLQKGGGWQRLVSTQSIRNAAVEITADVGYCAAKGQGFSIVAKTNRDRLAVVTGTASN